MEVTFWKNSFIHGFIILKMMLLHLLLATVRAEAQKFYCFLLKSQQLCYQSEHFNLLRSAVERRTSSPSFQMRRRASSDPRRRSHDVVVTTEEYDNVTRRQEAYENVGLDFNNQVSLLDFSRISRKKTS